MGRSRRRARTTATAAPAPRAAERKRAVAAPETDRQRRRILATYLVGAVLVAALVLLGTVTLLGTLGPFIVLVVAAAAGFGLHRWATTRLAGVALSDEDRTLQTMASGLLAIVVAFAAIAALVLSVA